VSRFSTISFRGLSKNYVVKGFAPIRALVEANIDDIVPGEILCVTGPNGSGKTTLLSCIAALSGAGSAQGSFLAYGETGLPVSIDPLRVFGIPQSPMSGLVPSLTVAENLVLRMMQFRGSRLRKAVREDRMREIEGRLAGLGARELEGRLEQPPSALSGGQQQVVNFVGAALSEPDIILADEPTSKLDEAHRVGVWRLLVQIARGRSVPVVWVSHDTREVQRLADRIVVMREGRIVDVQRRRKAKEARFVGAIRYAARVVDLPVGVRTVASDWWRPSPNGLFPDDYARGDDSRDGYLADRALSRDQRTDREVDGLLRISSEVAGSRKLTILDVPCGWGRHSLGLARRGHTVLGIDLCEEYVARARVAAGHAELGKRIEFRVDDMRTLASIQDRRFDLVVNVWTSFGFFGADEDGLILARWGQILKDGGQVLIHMDLNPDRVVHGLFDEPPTRKLKDGGDMEVVEHYCAEDKSVYGTWQVRGGRTHTYKIAVYSIEDWRAMGLRAGLRLRGVLGGLDPEEKLHDDRSQEIVLHFVKERKGGP